MSHPDFFLQLVIFTEAYIRHHLLHKSARKLLEMSDINGLSEIILRFLEEKCDMTVIFTFSVNILSTKLFKEIACEFYVHACKLIISF